MQMEKDDKSIHLYYKSSLARAKMTGYKIMEQLTLLCIKKGGSWPQVHKRSTFNILRETEILTQWD